jgi:hypothetical protein
VTIARPGTVLSKTEDIAQKAHGKCEYFRGLHLLLAPEKVREEFCFFSGSGSGWPPVQG